MIDNFFAMVFFFFGIVFWLFTFFAVTYMVMKVIIFYVTKMPFQSLTGNTRQTRLRKKSTKRKKVKSLT